MTLKSIRHNPHIVTKMAEEEIAEYVGSKYCVLVDSCTSAIFLSLKYFNLSNNEIIIPKRTYLSVPMSIVNSGNIPVFKDYKWNGRYELEIIDRPDIKLYDSAKRFTSNCHTPNTTSCFSFHVKKHITTVSSKGGAITTDSEEMYKWLRMARYEGRPDGKNYKDNDVDITFIGWNMYMTPEQSAHLLSLLQNYPEHVSDLIESGDYRDLTEFTVFKNYKII